MRVVVQHQPTNAIPPLETRFLEGFRETASTAVDIAVSATMQGMIWQARNDLLFGEDPADTLKNVRERQWVVHHRA
jgi:hypothetical protein